ncbi:MAG: MFS transporter [Chloroflexi bacterium]|nr:MFS transporter [Chloroflexota bacterium]MCI0859725.1 MFS transporter [Chloroflexota bacterium]MCI0866542.1 MFS transporter [Chloroflexota bacterium]MCI0895567.1 MFS transporter [Chloroflexota bacterium]
MIALASTQLLVQLSSMPIALTIPSVARHFDVDVAQAAWLVIIRLLLLGSTVFLAARLGEKYGHARVYLIGAVVLCVGSTMAATSLSFNQLLFWSGLVGIGGALITANSNAILAMVFDNTERGRAFAVPVVAARLGGLIGLVLFGVFLQFVSWRLVFLTSLPIGLLAIKYSYPLLKYQVQQAAADASRININYFGAALMVVTLGTFILSGMHLHDGAESFTTPEAVSYHIPMNLLFLSLLALFIVVQQRSREPFLDFRYFKQKYFSMALFTNTTFHLSMLAVVTLIPIMVEDGLGHMPIIVTMVLLPNQLVGLFLPTLAGWVHDRYNPRWLRPIALSLIALGFILVGFFAGDLPVWGLPILLFPVGIGSNLFNTANNAVVMNTLEENRSFASGMLETTRQMGHTIGTTISATILGLALPVAINVMPVFEAQAAFKQGFQYSALAVVGIMAAGAFVAMFQRMPQGARRARIRQPAPQLSGDS